jgi:hypothetical protein
VEIYVPCLLTLCLLGGGFGKGPNVVVLDSKDEETGGEAGLAP